MKANDIALVLLDKEPADKKIPCLPLFKSNNYPQEDGKDAFIVKWKPNQLKVYNLKNLVQIKHLVRVLKNVISMKKFKSPKTLSVKKNIII
jgi:hypothetical protein